MNFNGKSLKDLMDIVVGVESIDEILNLAGDNKERGFLYESIVNMIIKFGFFEKFGKDEYDNLDGNFNTGELIRIEDFEKYLEESKVKSGKSGGSSDITLKHKKTGKYICISCKYYDDMINKSNKDFDVQLITSVLKDVYEEEKYDIYVFVKDKEEVLNLVKNSERASRHITKYLDDEHVFGVKDLEVGYRNLREFYIQYKNQLFEFTLNQYFGIDKKMLKMRYHQKMIVKRVLNFMKKYKNDIFKNLLIACKCRSGKTFIVGGIIVEMKREFNGSLNVLILTPAPTETTPQFVDDLLLKFLDFEQFKIHEVLSGSYFDDIENKLGDNNIFVVSKQLMQNYIEEKGTQIDILTNFFNLIVFDENHHGGTTELSQQILNTYSTEDSFQVYLTATYQKPLKQWDILDEGQFYWDIEDEQLCKRGDLEKLREKHGDIEDIDVEELKRGYEKYPDLFLMTNMFNQQFFNQVKLKIQDSKYGFGFDTLFSLTEDQSQFKYPQEIQDVLAFISGSRKEDMFGSDELNRSFFNRIKKISQKYNSRTLLNNGNFTSQLWFLPFGIGLPINTVSTLLKELMKQDFELKKYEIVILNSTMDTKVVDIKDYIFKTEKRAKRQGKAGLIILVGNMCSLGITLPLVDIVFLLSTTVSSDKIIQMMMRSMTEGISPESNNYEEYKSICSNVENKRIGYVVDMNISRVLNTLFDYQRHKKSKSADEKLGYIIKNNLINIDEDIFESDGLNKDTVVERLITVWKEESMDKIRTIIRKIENDIIELEKEDQKEIMKFFKNIKLDQLKKGPKVEMDLENQQHLPSGKETKSGGSSGKTDDDEEEEDLSFLNKISLTKDILPSIIPFSCLLTIQNDENNFIENLKTISNSEELLDIFNTQCNIWWNQPKSIEFIKKLIYIIEKYIKEDSDIYNISIFVKMELKSLLDRPKELINFIQESLRPKNYEKREFGEVFTPMSFVEKMLDDLTLIDPTIWSNPNLKWLDPANGMGNFPIAIYYRLMNGLKEIYPDDSERKHHILTKMIYMIELNKKNCFLTKQIFGENEDLKLNLIEGDSLKESFDIPHFDIIIGNPPYNKKQTDRGELPPIYHEFVLKYITKCKYLSFVIPSRWFSGGKPELNKFRVEMLKRRDIRYIKHYSNEKEVFGNSVEIKGGVNYFLKDSTYNGDCLFNDKPINLSKYDILVEDKYNSILSKIIHLPSITSIFKNRYFKIETNDTNLCDDTSLVRCYVSSKMSNQRIKYIHKNYIKEEYNFWKVITTTGTHGAYSGFGYITILNPTEIHNTSYVSFEVKTEEEAESLVSYLKCKLTNLLLSIRKNNQIISEKTIKWIPLVPFDRIWTDQLLIDYFQLTEDDRNFIENIQISGYLKEDDNDDNTISTESTTNSVQKSCDCGYLLKNGKNCTKRGKSEYDGLCQIHFNIKNRVPNKELVELLSSTKSVSVPEKIKLKKRN